MFKNKKALLIAAVLVTILAGTVGIYWIYGRDQGKPALKSPSQSSENEAGPAASLELNSEPVAESENATLAELPSNSESLPAPEASTDNFDDHMVGLYNYSQTCFGNAMTQFLYHSRDFRAALDKYLSNSAADDEVENRTAAQELRDIFKQLDEAEDFSHVTPKKYGGFPPEMRRNVQSDSSEILGFYNLFRDFDWSAFSIGYRIFNNFNNNGLFDDPSNADQSETYLPLSFDQEDHTVTIDYLIEEYFTESQRAVEDREREIGVNTASTCYKIKSLPENVIIQVKRFRKEEKDGKTVLLKNNSNINLMFDIIDFDPFLENDCSKERTRYQLVSFIVHMGKSLKSGHYYTIFKRSDDTWVRINDTRCEQISREEMVREAKDGYLFMYRRL